MEYASPVLGPSHGPIQATFQKGRLTMRKTPYVVALVLVLVSGLLVAGAAKTAKTAAKRPPTGPKRRHVTITLSGNTCTAHPTVVHPKRDEYVVWSKSGTDKHTVKFVDPKGTPCDNGIVSFDMQDANVETTACTVYKVPGPYPTNPYKYEIWADNGGVPTKCADPSVIVEN
jgi:hypothetical protein